MNSLLLSTSSYWYSYLSSVEYTPLYLSTILQGRNSITSKILHHKETDELDVNVWRTIHFCAASWLPELLQAAPELTQIPVVCEETGEEVHLLPITRWAVSVFAEQYSTTTEKWTSLHGTLAKIVMESKQQGKWMIYFEAEKPPTPMVPPSTLSNEHTVKEPTDPIVDCIQNALVNILKQFKEGETRTVIKLQMNVGRLPETCSGHITSVDGRFSGEVYHFGDSIARSITFEHSLEYYIPPKPVAPPKTEESGECETINYNSATQGNNTKATIEEIDSDEEEINV
jgi:hypothetical protein